MKKMKNVEYSQLYYKYRSLVVDYKYISEQIVKNKIEMSYLWKYKKEYPEDWKRKSDLLTSDKAEIKSIKSDIIAIKAKMRQCTIDYNKK
jgi:hypothetical protein